MKKLLVLSASALAITSIFAISACSISPIKVVRATGPEVTKDYGITDFNAVQTGGVFQLEIVPSTAYAISVTSNENMFDYIEVNKSGSTLRLNLKSGTSITGPLTLKAKITMPELDGLDLSGAATADASGFKSTKDFRLALSGAARVDMGLETGKFVADISSAGRAAGSLKAADTRLNLSGAAVVEIQGSGANAVIDGSGASNASLSDFAVKDASVTLSGGSRAAVNASGKLDVGLSGGSTLQYSGNPTLGKVNVSGGSTLRKSGD